MVCVSYIIVKAPHNGDNKDDDDEYDVDNNNNNNNNSLTHRIRNWFYKPKKKGK
jgi:hypothetical protein